MCRDRSAWYVALPDARDGLCSLPHVRLTAPACTIGCHSGCCGGAAMAGCRSLLRATPTPKILVVG